MVKREILNDKKNIPRTSRLEEEKNQVASIDRSDGANMLKLRMIVTWKDTWQDKSRQHFL
jgi:hypothetical protein